MNKHFLILLTTTVVTGLCLEISKTNNFIPKFNQIEEDHSNSNCSERAMPCESDEECCSDLVCKDGFVNGPGLRCLLNHGNCLDNGNNCYSKEECCSGNCFIIPGVGNKCY